MLSVLPLCHLGFMLQVDTYVLHEKKNFQLLNVSSIKERATQKIG
jgi:hypothetical protein